MSLYEEKVIKLKTGTASTSKINKLKISQKIYYVLKSILDFFAALIALIILIPLFIIVSIAIKVDSKGPVFFVQKRIGKNGKLFNCIKFRSMSVSAKHDIAGYEYAEVNSYITKTGAIIRKFSIDELPQLLNILTFKMSFIGYRPSQPSEHELNEAREYYNMYRIKPGISGWAQINGRDVLAAHPTIKAQFDNYYLQHFSFWLDVKIFFLTIVKVFKKNGVQEGVLTPQSNEINNKEAFANTINEIANEDIVEDETVNDTKEKEVV